MSELNKRQLEILSELDLRPADFEELDNTQIDQLIDTRFTLYASQNQNRSISNAIPTITSKNSSAIVEYEASIGKVSDDAMIYLYSRGFDDQQATSLIISGQCREVLSKLPLEFAVEARKLISDWV